MKFNLKYAAITIALGSNFVLSSQSFAASNENCTNGVEITGAAQAEIMDGGISLKYVKAMPIQASMVGEGALIEKVNLTFFSRTSKMNISSIGQSDPCRDMVLAFFKEKAKGKISKFKLRLLSTKEEQVFGNGNLCSIPGVAKITGSKWDKNGVWNIDTLTLNNVKSCEIKIEHDGEKEIRDALINGKCLNARLDPSKTKNIGTIEPGQNYKVSYHYVTEQERKLYTNSSPHKYEAACVNKECFITTGYSNNEKTQVTYATDGDKFTQFPEISIWGAIFTFDSNGKLYSKGTEVGTLEVRDSCYID